MTQADSQATRKRIADFLAEHTTLTLATVGADGTPAAAAVFYAHDEDLTLYFLSEDGTQHARNIVAVPRVAGTVHDDGQEWRAIRGLQLRGCAEHVPASRIVHAAAVYDHKFAFVAAALGGSEGPTVLSGPLARARFWQVTPEWFRLVDNRVRFGHKEELEMRGTGR